MCSDQEIFAKAVFNDDIAIMIELSKRLKKNNKYGSIVKETWNDIVLTDVENRIGKLKPNVFIHFVIIPLGKA